MNSKRERKAERERERVTKTDMIRQLDGKVFLRGIQTGQNFPPKTDSSFQLTSLQLGFTFTLAPPNQSKTASISSTHPPSLLPPYKRHCTPHTAPPKKTSKKQKKILHFLLVANSLLYMNIIRIKISTDIGVLGEKNFS